MVRPEYDPPVIVEWLINVHAHGNQVGLSVSIHVRRFETDEMSRRVADVMLCEVHFAVVLVPDYTLRFRLFPEVIATDGGNIQIAIAVKIGCDRGAGTRQKTDGVMLEFEITLVFEPLDAVPRTWAWRQVVKGVSIRVEDVH